MWIPSLDCPHIEVSNAPSECVVLRLLPANTDVGSVRRSMETADLHDPATLPVAGLQSGTSAAELGHASLQTIVTGGA